MSNSEAEKHSEICSKPCPTCEAGMLENGEECPQCGGTGCLDKYVCELGKGLGCNDK